MRILFVGDVFGQAGRKIVHDHYHHVVESREVDLSIVNVENAAGGFGVTPQIAEEFFDLGADVLTTGNHVWDKKEIFAYLKTGASDPASRNRRLLRPGNYPDGTPGFGWFEGQTRGGVLFGVINLQGRVFMTQNDDPFRKADELLQKMSAKVVLVDFHAEATSEKVAMGWYLDGRVTAVLGTHTHVPTAD
ncbi:MAG TPA: TIGR00282 family metallophosphoesterase, partial [Terriglobales bacterium]